MAVLIGGLASPTTEEEKVLKGEGEEKEERRRREGGEKGSCRIGIALGWSVGEVRVEPVLARLSRPTSEGSHNC